MSLVSQVQENLLFQQLWTKVSQHQISNSEITLLHGLPKEKLISTDEESRYEYVLPIKMGQDLTPNYLNQVFEGLEQGVGRIIVGIVNDDGTVVYYIVHEGVYKPKKN